MAKNNGVHAKLGDRLRGWRKTTFNRAYQLGEHIKISQGSLSDIENNKSHPSANTLAKLHNLTHLNIIWLLTGRGEIVRPITKEGKPGEIDWELNGILERVKKIYDKRSTKKGAEKKMRLDAFLSGLEFE